MTADPGTLVLALVGGALASVALFVNYDGFSSLWSEVGERDSAEFFLLPAVAVAAMLGGIVLLQARPRWRPGCCWRSGSVDALHFVGVLIAAWRAIGEVGEVGSAGVIGLFGGALVLAAGAYAAAMKNRPAGTNPASLIGRDGARYPLDEPRWRGDDGSPLLVEPLPGITRDGHRPSVRSQWRYAAALPLPLTPVSLGEGCTPLLAAPDRRGRPRRQAGVVQPDRELQGPRHDRDGLAARAPGRHAMLEDSSGNGGASVAAYAAAAGIDAKILAPDSTSEAKTLQSRMHGAALELVPGPRQATADEAVRQSTQRFYASHNWHPFFLQGTKLIAYEIWEDLGFRAPDACCAPRAPAAWRSGARSASTSCCAPARSPACRGCWSPSPSTAARSPARSQRAMKR